jgi:hypothetical protein
MRNLNVIPTEKLFASTRNLNVIPTKKLFAFDKKRFFSREKLFQNNSSVLSFRQRSFLLRRGISMSFRQRSFLLRRGIYVLSIKRDSSIAKSSFRMTVAFCHSDREALFASTRNLCVFDKKRFFSREELFQNDSSVLSFRQRSFLLRRGIYVLSIKRDSSVAKSSFRMTVAFCHSDREAFASTRNLCAFDKKRFFNREKLLQNDSSVLSFRQRSSFDFDEESMCFR